MRIVKNDMVKVLSGKYRNKVSKVLKVYPKDHRVIVEGVNVIKRHTKPSQKNPQGGIIEKEAPIDMSKVMLVCNKCNQPTRVGSRILEDGSKARYCKQCGEIITTNA